MSSPLTNSPDVKSIIDAIAARNVGWLEGLRSQRVPSPSHLMFACATVMGDQEQVAEFMKGVAGRDKRDRFIDLAIKLAQAEDAPATQQAPAVQMVAQPAPQDVPAVEVAEVEEGEEAPKRRRRSSATAQAPAQVQLSEGALDTILQCVTDSMTLTRELAKSIYAIEARIGAIETRISEAESSTETHTRVTHSVLVVTKQLEVRLDLIRDALAAAELELVSAGKLDSAAMSDVMDASWPS